MNYYSQIGQDKYYIENIAKRRLNGIFLDVGAHNGIFNSNTYALEKFLGWYGICVEANTDLIPKLTQNRPNSTVINKAVWKTKDTLTLEIPLTDSPKIYGNELSRLTNIERNSNYFTGYFNKPTKKISVQADTITSILVEEKILRVDYASIDTEGAELEALLGIDFSVVSINFITIEHGNRPNYIEEISNILIPNNYKLHRINRFDVEYEKII